MAVKLDRSSDSRVATGAPAAGPAAAPAAGASSAISQITEPSSAMGGIPDLLADIAAQHRVAANHTAKKTLDASRRYRSESMDSESPTAAPANTPANGACKKEAMPKDSGGGHGSTAPHALREMVATAATSSVHARAKSSSN